MAYASGTLLLSIRTIDTNTRVAPGEDKLSSQESRLQQLLTSSRWLLHVRLSNLRHSVALLRQWVPRGHFLLS